MPVDPRSGVGHAGAGAAGGAGRGRGDDRPAGPRVQRRAVAGRADPADRDRGRPGGDRGADRGHVAGATEQAVGTDTPPYVADGSPQVSGAELALLDRGVRFRAIYASEVLDHPALVARLSAMAERGEQARVLPQVPLKLLIVDGTTAILPLAGENPPDSRPSGQARAVVVTDSVLTNALQVLFDQLWAQATPLRLTSTADPVTDLINLLAHRHEGRDDRSSARHQRADTPAPNLPGPRAARRHQPLPGGDPGGPPRAG